MRKLIVAALLALALLTGTAAAQPRGANGLIVVNVDNRITHHEEVYAVNPDGSGQRLLYVDGEAGQWSPDGSRFAIFTDCCGSGTINPDSDAFTSLHLDTQYPSLFLGCGVWSPDGATLACEGLSFDVDPSLNGIYTVSAANGGGLQRITSEPFGDDCPSDYSPNGKELVATLANDSGAGIFTVKLDGGATRRLTPPEMEFNFCNGRWSPQGNEIVFSAHVPADHHSSMWVVHSDGTGLRELPVADCGGLNADPGAIGCFNPTWSPDGSKILFARRRGNDQADLYTVNADGSGLVQVTNTPGLDEVGPDWGTHPLAP